MAREYKCIACQQTFSMAWSDEEAIAELAENFGTEFKPSDCAVMCDDCYQMNILEERN